MSTDERHQAWAETMTAVDEAASKVREWTMARDERIAAAVAAGASQREVGRIAGLSHTAVQHIIKRYVTESA